jgi:hypothetical protein
MSFSSDEYSVFVFESQGNDAAMGKDAIRRRDEEGLDCFAGGLVCLAFDVLLALVILTVICCFFGVRVF